MGFSRVDAQSESRSEGRNSLLAYGFDEAGQAVLHSLLVQAGIEELLVVGDQGTGLLLSELLEDAPQQTAMDPLPPCPVAVFHAVSDAELNRFLTLFRESGLPRPLFAVVTPTSIHWRFGELASELLRERRAMEKPRNT